MTPRTYTHPSVLQGIADGADWADPTMDPTEIDWTVRQAIAAIPFELVDGRPVNPCQQTGTRYGRNELGHWAEQLCADTLVRATDEDGHPWVVMVKRGDGHGWALPGGYVDLNETAIEAAARELDEETGLTLHAMDWEVSEPRYVPDPRASDEAWMVTVLCTVDLGAMRWARFPVPVGSDDAVCARWVRADTYDMLATSLADNFGGQVFPAHVDILKGALL